MRLLPALVLIAALGGHPAAAQESTLAARPQAAPTVTLTPNGPAAVEYATGRSLTAGQQRLARRLREAGFTVQLSSCLSRAAQAYARAVSPDSEAELPMAAIEFLLHRAGCPDATASATVVYTTEDGVDEVLDELKGLLGQSGLRGTTHVGLARIPAATSPYRWRWGVLLATRRFSLRPVPIEVEPGTHFTLQLELGTGLDAPEVLVTRPGGKVETLLSSASGSKLAAVVPAGSTAGTLWVEVVAQGAHGPEVVALFPVAVGMAPPETWSGPAAPAEDWIRLPAQAEAYLAELVDRDRTVHGLPPLVRDGELSDVARAHSADMARAGYFGHHSPTAGGLFQRLAAASYRARWAGENVARAASIQEAEEALMRSPGHRANILAPEATHLGVGVAAGRGDDRWLVTQIFTDPGAGLDAPGWRRALGEEMDRARVRRGLTPLNRVEDLATVASQLARRLAAGNVKTHDLLVEAKDVLEGLGRSPGRLMIRTARIWTPDQLPFDETEPGWVAATGIGALVPKDSTQPVAVVILLADSPATGG